MSDPRITDEAVQALHHRVVHEVRLRGVLTLADARSALEAAVPLLAPRPVVDREALVKVIDAAGSLKVGGTLWPLDRKNVREIADAVLALINGSAS